MRRTAGVALAVLLAAAAGCGGTRPGEYADSTNPGTTHDTSATRGVPDSTDGVSQRTGRPGVAGDSTQRRP
jgi:hypothetical protein